MDLCSLKNCHLYPVKNSILILAIIFCFSSCQKRAEEEANQYSIENPLLQDSIVAEEPTLKTLPNTAINRDSLDIFLDKPFDFYKFKKIKGGSNSTIGKQEDYFFNPNGKGMYYSYFLFSQGKGYLGTNKDRIIQIIDGLEIIVYKKLGKYQYNFIDPTEELIEVRAKFNDFDLPELALVGLDSVSIVSKFGKPDLVKMSCLVYHYNGKALVLNLSNERVQWLKYVKLKKGLDITRSESIFEK